MSMFRTVQVISQMFDFIETHFTNILNKPFLSVTDAEWPCQSFFHHTVEKASHQKQHEVLAGGLKYQAKI